MTNEDAIVRHDAAVGGDRDPDRIYRGYRTNHVPVVVVDDADGSGHELAHRVRHSPTGFEWGYGGSGPADLARCLLIDALGWAARCRPCGGSGKLVVTEAGSERPFHPDSDGDVHPELVGVCPDCLEDGVTVMPALYQRFKHEVVAGFAVRGVAPDPGRDHQLGGTAPGRCRPVTGTSGGSGPPVGPGDDAAQAVLALHMPFTHADGDSYCVHCSVPNKYGGRHVLIAYPCPTVVTVKIAQGVIRPGTPPR